MKDVAIEMTFDQAGRLPMEGDNVAIAIRELPAGARILTEQGPIALPHAILEGHRFAVAPIANGSPLLSWRLPFAHAIRNIQPGDYICNERILRVLRQRHVAFNLPSEPNIQDYYERYVLDEKRFVPGEQVPRIESSATFQGFHRDQAIGVGTRNYIVILGVSSLASSFVRELARRLSPLLEHCDRIDGIVPVAHTEGGEAGAPNNRDLVLRALSAFMVHPNVGAVLCVDRGGEPINNSTLERFLETQGYPIHSTLHGFYSLTASFERSMEQAGRIVEKWIPTVDACRRAEAPLSQLKIALQCGGSDAFSGISGNPLAGAMARRLIQHGGAANLAETDELIGAEPYILNNTRNLDVARSFLKTIERFETLAGWHGHNGQSNPSGGNNYRGLYNIAIKSIGAARKKDPEVRLDEVIEYGQRMARPGFYFMDSPGNDLESVAGQVASGANMILFVTGNGSITNFPFVPTLKIVTTTGRYNLMPNEMDINAGRYQDGESMESLADESFKLMIETASGKRSAGEHAGHSQVQLWRNWRQGNSDLITHAERLPAPSGNPIPHAIESLRDNRMDELLAKYADRAIAQFGLVLPTSLCSGQVARIMSARLNRDKRDSQEGPQEWIALAHTEGCGSSDKELEQLHLRTLCGYLRHPLVRKSILLEHGCEKTHNDAFKNFMRQNGVDPGAYGFASIQLDGGVERVALKIAHWAAGSHSSHRSTIQERQPLSLAVCSTGPLSENFHEAQSRIAGWLLANGGAVITPDNEHAAAFRSRPTRATGGASEFSPTLAHGEIAAQPGFHVMETQTSHWVETITGLGATGALAILSFSNVPQQAHPLVPVIQIGPKEASEDFDLTFDSRTPESEIAASALETTLRTLAGDYQPVMRMMNNADFQITRGRFGVSL